MPTPLGVRTGSEVVAVPDLYAKDAAEAVETAIRAGLVPSVVADRDARATAGRVHIQNPAAGTSVHTGTSVTLSVGAGFSSQMVDVPNVVGLSSADAAARLATNGYSAQIVGVSSRPGVFRGGDQVVAQTPAGRFAADQARVVRIFVVGP